MCQSYPPLMDWALSDQGGTGSEPPLGTQIGKDWSGGSGPPTPVPPTAAISCPDFVLEPECAVSQEHCRESLQLGLGSS